MTQPAKQNLREVGSKTPASPLKVTKPKEPMTRSQRYAALSERLLAAAEIGAEGLVKLIQDGGIKGRDLAVVVGILLDKLAQLEQRQDPPSASVAELRGKLNELAAVQQELERRGALPVPPLSTLLPLSDPPSRALP